MSRASGHLPELRLQCLEELIEDGVDVVISRPGRGGDTGRLEAQFLSLPYTSPSVAHNRLRSSANGRSGRSTAMGDSILHDKFMSEPGNVKVDADIVTVALAGIRGQFNASLHKMPEGFAPHHFMDEF